MIIIYHQNNKVTKIWDEENHSDINIVSVKISKTLLEIAQKFPERLIIWCNSECQANLNHNTISSIFHHKKIMASFHPADNNYLDEKIGYVSELLFANPNKKVPYPTWLMSSYVGGIYSEIILALKNNLQFDNDFDYFLNSLSKLAMPFGLLCYSNPNLLQKPNQKSKLNQGNIYDLFRFVKQHHKTRWIFLLFTNLLLYERRFPLLPLIYSFFFKSRKVNTKVLSSIKIKSTFKVVDMGTIDVIIPTIGRKQYLYDVLKDLSKQTHIPNNVIIVEQNPLQNSESDLDYLNSEKWPFEIKHIFTHQSGACNARNLALTEIKNEWTFFADDDIRIENDFIEKAFSEIEKMNNKVYTFKCFQEGEIPLFHNVFQWLTFGSGCSFVKNDAIFDCKFNMSYEFGFGEDADFGMQLRKKGNDVIFLPEPGILHLKAPIGGFRTKPVLAWHSDEIQPKPSPTVLLYILMNNTKQQLLGYKTTLFFKYYKNQKIKNPFKYYKIFQKQWNRSLFWANELIKSAI